MLIARLCDYVLEAIDRPLPDEVREKTKQHVLDTIAAMVSGAELKPGRLAIAYAAAQGGTPQASIVGSGLLTTVTNAAHINGMLAHADETDDSHAPSLTHPGCSIVPAALAMAEAVGASGEELLRAVALGYDICTRTNLAITEPVLRKTKRSTYSISGAFGAMAAAATLARLGPESLRYAVSYTAQQASGLSSWRRDKEHVEKAFVFAGMPARNGVAAVAMVQAGFTGVADVLEEGDTFFDAFAPDGDPEALVDGLGSRYEIMRTNVKRWSVGSPIQAAVDSLVSLIREHDLTVDEVARVTARLPVGGAETVDDRHMPDINLQHCLAVTLIDRDLTFVATQDYERMHDENVLNVKRRITLVGDPELDGTDPPRQGIIELETTDGRSLRHRTHAVRGTADNPMSADEVAKKARDLLDPVLGSDRSAELISSILGAESIGDVTALRPLFRVDEGRYAL